MASLFKHTHPTTSLPASRSRFALTLALLLLTLTGRAQTLPLQIQVNVLPPYSAYLQDYPGTGQQLRVLLINTSRNTYQVRLTGQLTGDNGIEIRTAPNYRPLRPVTVPPGQTLLSRNDLEGLFDLNQIEVTGIDKNVLVRGLPLPDGMYQLCVRAFNETATNTATVAFGQPLSAEFPLGCSAPIIVRAVEPPILISPLCDATVTATVPQAVVFTWTPPPGVSPAQVDYTLRIVELPQAAVDPNVFIDAVALPRSGVEVGNLRTSTFLYGPTQPPLQLGKRYAWRVQATDRSRKINFLNDGKSPVCAFQYGPADTAVAVSMVKSKRLNSAAKLVQFSFCGQTIQVKKLTNPSLDHFTGKGTLLMKSPVKLAVDVDFADLVVRPLKYQQHGKRQETNGFDDFAVVRGKLEASLKGASGKNKAVGLKTDSHTGGTAEITYQNIRLMADHTDVFDEKLNAHVLEQGGTETADIQTGVTWHSPIALSQQFAVYNTGKQGPLAPVTTSGYTNGDFTVDIPGEWRPIETAGKDIKLAPTLKIPFGAAYSGNLADLKGFKLSLLADSYFEISSGKLTARLRGSVTVPSGRTGVGPMTVAFQETDGIAFTAPVDDQQMPLSVIKGTARLFLSFQKVNVQLGDLFDADDLPYPLWVKGVSCPETDFWASKMVYLQDSDHPTSQDHLGWTTVRINPVVNRGKGYESTNADTKGLKMETKFLGFKGKITRAIVLIKNTEFKVGHLVGQVYVPFVNSVGELQIFIEKYGLDDAEVISFEKSERILLQTPTGDRVTVTTTGGYFKGNYFYPDMSFSVYNETDATRGLDAKEIRMDGIDVAITPQGELVSNYIGKKAEAFYGGSKQKTAYINGLDYHLDRVLLADAAGGKQCRLSFNGKLVLGEKIVTGKEYLYEVLFDKPKSDDFAFTGTIPNKGANNTPYGLPNLPAGKPEQIIDKNKKGGGPSVDEDAGIEMGVQPETTVAGYYLERSAPASTMGVNAQTVHGEFNTGTANFKGDFTLYTDDATYGNGFRLNTKMQTFTPVNTLVAAMVIAGKAQGVKYWFAGFKYESPDTPGIPLFLNLEAYGFEGRIYSHMRHAGDPQAIFNDNYVPDAKTSFGLYAAMPIQSAADKGVLLWGKTGVEITFSGFVPSEIMVRGDVNMEQLGGTGDASTSRIQGNAVFVIAPKEKTMMGTVNMTKGDFGAACLTGSAWLYTGPSGFAVSVGAPGQPLKATALCGAMGDLTPSATAYAVLYATNGSIGGMGWIPTSGIGIRVHLGATLLDLKTKDYFNTDPWASLYAGADADVAVQIRPTLDLKARVGTQISLNVGYGSYSYNLANVTETVQLTLPSFCLAYNKRICFPVLGGCNLIVGLGPGPYMRTNGSASDMCYNDGTVQGPCEGLLGWLMDGAQVVINAVGEVLDTAGNLIKDAAGAFVGGAKKVGKAIEGLFCSLFC